MNWSKQFSYVLADDPSGATDCTSAQLMEWNKPKLLE